MALRPFQVAARNPLRRPHPHHSRGIDADGADGVAQQPAGRPHISYCDWEECALHHAWFNGSGWATETVDSPYQVGYSTSLALDSRGRPRIAYFDSTCWDLKYAAATIPGPWQVHLSLVQRAQ